jgi:hypothetical protein
MSSMKAVGGGRRVVGGGSGLTVPAVTGEGIAVGGDRDEAGSSKTVAATMEGAEQARAGERAGSRGVEVEAGTRTCTGGVDDWRDRAGAVPLDADGRRGGLGEMPSPRGWPVGRVARGGVLGEDGGQAEALSSELDRPDSETGDGERRSGDETGLGRRSVSTRGDGGGECSTGGVGLVRNWSIGPTVSRRNALLFAASAKALRWRAAQRSQSTPLVAKQVMPSMPSV